MGFVISAGTLVTGMGAVQSVSVDLSPQIQRLYQLGSTIPYNKNIITQHRMSVTSYGDSGTPVYSTIASTDCLDSDTIDITVSPGICAGLSINEIADDWYVTGYSYTKDAQGWGSESWTLVTAPLASDAGAVVPVMIRGIAEGSATTDGGADTGVEFLVDLVTGVSIQVQAGSPGIGRANSSVFGEISSVGNATTGQGTGLTGSANVSIPYTPIYLNL